MRTILAVFHTMALTWAANAQPAASAPVEAPISKLLWKARADIPLPEGPGHLTSVAFTPDSEKLLAAAGKTIRLFNVKTGRKEEEFECGAGVAVITIALSPDGRLLAVVARGQKGIALWDLVAKKERRRLPGNLVYSESVTFSPDGKRLASANGTTVCIFDPGSDGLKSRLARSKDVDGHVTTDLCFTRDGTMLATGSLDTGSIVFWDLVSKKELGTLETKPGDAHRIAIARTASGWPRAVTAPRSRCENGT